MWFCLLFLFAVRRCDIAQRSPKCIPMNDLAAAEFFCVSSALNHSVQTPHADCGPPSETSMVVNLLQPHSHTHTIPHSNFPLPLPNQRQQTRPNLHPANSPNSEQASDGLGRFESKLFPYDVELDKPMLRLCAQAFAQISPNSLTCICPQP